MKKFLILALAAVVLLAVYYGAGLRTDRWKHQFPPTPRNPW